MTRRKKEYRATQGRTQHRSAWYVQNPRCAALFCGMYSHCGWSDGGLHPCCQPTLTALLLPSATLRLSELHSLPRPHFFLLRVCHFLFSLYLTFQTFLSIRLCDCRSSSCRPSTRPSHPPLYHCSNHLALNFCISRWIQLLTRRPELSRSF